MADNLIRCDRCCRTGTIKYVLGLINIDETSVCEGEHFADVEIWLCPQCEEDVAKLLPKIRQMIIRKEI